MVRSEYLRGIIMNELKKEIKKFYIMFGIEAPAAFFLLFLFSYYILKRQFYPSSYLVISFSIALIAFDNTKDSNIY